MSQNPLLEIKNLQVDFHNDDGSTRAVDGVSFSIEPNSITAVVGESGSGKSVSSLSVMRLLSTRSSRLGGEIWFGGKNLFSLSENEMRQRRGKDISMIFQEPMTSLNPVFTCGKQVAEALVLHQKISWKEAREKTIKLFEEVKLPRPENIYDSYPHQLSGGQKQRVMIAMAISCGPSLLIADEPTTALDVTVQKNILELIRQLKEKNGMGVLFITHDLSVVSEISDNVVVMYHGKIVEQGKTREVFSNPKHPYTKGLMACRPKPGMKGQRLHTVSDFLDTDTMDAIEQKASISNTSFFQKPESNTEPEILLSVKGLKKWYPIRKGIFGRTEAYVKAVDDVTFEAYKGETLGLVGESGCGKTTLGRCILRLIEPTQGEIIFGNKEILKLKDSEMRLLRKDLQIIFQDPYSSLNPRMRIGEAILEPMTVHGLHGNRKSRREKTVGLLEKVGLKAEHFNRFPHEFSGGQRQRICIARALAVEPKFIVCDESVSALDVSVQATVLNLLNDLKNEFGLTHIFISHDLGVVHYMSDRVAVMNQGKIEELGTADEIYNHPKSEYTQKLLHSLPKFIS